MTPADLFTLAGRTVLLTGAGGAIGSVLAKGMADAGAVVGLQDIDLARVAPPRAAIHDTGGRTYGFAADLSSPEACHRLVEEAAEVMGRIDVLVNCAGVNRRKPIVDVTPDDFEAIVAVNMRAVFFMSQAVHPVMKSAGGGSIVNISSLSARFSYATISVYAASKAAVSSITRSCAREWAGDGIRVNCIEPSVVQTEFTRPLWDDPKRGAWFQQHSPLGRLAMPSELVGAVVYLASDASSYVTGQAIAIEGGITTGADWDG